MKKCLLDCSRAKGCGNCTHMAPILEKLSKEHPDKFIVVKADSDKIIDLCWMEVPNDGKPKTLPFIKAYSYKKHLGNIFGVDMKGLENLVTLLTTTKPDTPKDPAVIYNATSSDGLNQKKRRF